MHDRRARLTMIGLSLVAALAGPAGAATPPNVVILLADDLGWSDVGYHGSDIETPNIDSLAAGGVQLDRLYVAPSCTPTRAALMTGRDPLRLGVAWFPIMPWSNKAVSPNERFISRDFQTAGYQTGMVGKWHLGHTLDSQLPNARGFDEFFGHLHTAVDYFTHVAPGGGYDVQHNGASVKRPGRYLTDVHGEEAARFIRKRDPDRPFFLYVPFLAPHSPIQAPPELIEKYGAREDPIERGFAAMVDSMDQAIGAILDALESEGLVENTIVLFLSDNGGSVGLGGRNTPLRGSKQTVFEGGIRVVGVLRWPAELTPGTISTQRISVMDLYPTLARAAGVRRGGERPLDGRDQWEAIRSGGAAAREGDLFFAAESPLGGPEHAAVLSGRWKLVQLVDRHHTSIEVETMLFDVEADPYEQSDRASDEPTVVADLATRLEAWRSLHPVAGQRVEIVPHPGWRSPKNWALAPLPVAETLLENGEVHAGEDTVIELLQKTYGSKGRVHVD